ncbi:MULTISPECIES: ImmA/IrrE family metallo-endopeptidase [Bacillus]|uniref:ImmA/IrrE family metallo-endopeptidase n=1 Tax=Bacillus TaxID=1386 RepID=UPI002E1C7F9C|nr:ImmA/IrrE family metallo-endopeptidase [Bacillus smithii]MED4928160.1 ImmA/IrrE family metallo-endopeptidase [Bacillus smithii]
MDWIERIVNKLVKSCKTNDPYEIAAQKNINVIQWNLHHEIMGFYKYIRRNKFIFINSNLNEDIKRFVCAHELGHSQLHHRVNTPFLKQSTYFSVDKIEVEANFFAVRLLLSDEDLKNYETKYQVLREHGIPLEMERFL